MRLRSFLLTVVILLSLSSLAWARYDDRYASLYFGPSAGYVVDSDFQDDAGFLIYGLELTFKFAVIPNLALGGNVGSRFSYKSGGVEIPKISEELSQTVVSSISPIEFLISYEILPDGDVNPFLGVGLGADWVYLVYVADSIPDEVDIGVTDLSERFKGFVFGASPTFGVDFSLAEKMGLFFDIRYHYLTKLKVERSVAAVKSYSGSGYPEYTTKTESRDLDLSHADMRIGLIFYFD